jgi:hypothetical protein
VSGRQSLLFLPLSGLTEALLVEFDLLATAGVRSITGAGVVLQPSTSDVSEKMKA